MDDAESADISGALHNLSCAKDHAVIDRFCGVNAVILAMDALAIAASRGSSETCKHATDQAVLAKSKGCHCDYACNVRPAAQEVA